jgi:hypothetical protein
VPIADVSPELRPRALAISVVELIRVEWPRLGDADAAPPAPPPVAPSAQQEIVTPPPDPFVDRRPSPPPAHTNRHAVAVSPALVAWLFPSRSTTLLGPGASASLEIGSFRASTGGQVAFGQNTLSVGTIDVGWASAYLGLGLTGRGSLRGIVEPRLYLGHGWATGTASDPNRTEGTNASGLVIATTLAFGLRSELAEGWDALADVEIGYAGRGLSFLADQESAAGLARLLVGARIGISRGL